MMIDSLRKLFQRGNPPTFLLMTDNTNRKIWDGVYAPDEILKTTRGLPVKLCQWVPEGMVYMVHKGEIVQMFDVGGEEKS